MDMEEGRECSFDLTYPYSEGTSMATIFNDGASGLK